MTTENTAPVDDFGDTDDDFDLDSWIEQGSRPHREVPVYRNWELLREYDRLIALLPADKEQAAALAEESMADEGPAAIHEQLDDVLERMKASELRFVVKALTGEEKRDLARKAPMKPVLDGDGKPILNAAGEPRKQVDNIALGDMTVAAAVVSVTDMATGKAKSSISAKQLKRLRTTLGDGPTFGLYKAVGELSEAGQALPPVPFSREH